MKKTKLKKTVKVLILGLACFAIVNLIIFLLYLIFGSLCIAESFYLRDDSFDFTTLGYEEEYEIGKNIKDFNISIEIEETRENIFTPREELIISAFNKDGVLEKDVILSEFCNERIYYKKDIFQKDYSFSGLDKRTYISRIKIQVKVVDPNLEQYKTSLVITNME